MKAMMPEVWIINRDTKVPEVYVLAGDDYERQAPDNDGWVQSAATDIRFCAETGGRLTVQMASDRDTRQLLPED